MALTNITLLRQTLHQLEPCMGFMEQLPTQVCT